MKLIVFGSNSFTASYFDWVSEFETILLSRNDFNQPIESNDSIQEINNIIQKFKPDVILNLIAISATALNSWEKYYTSNFLITRQIIEACLIGPYTPAKFIQASSAHVYGTLESSCITEDMPTNPSSIYAKTKAMAELFTSFFENRLNLIIARPFNYTGIGQNSQNFFIPKIIEAVVKKKSRIDLGDLNLIRDFSDVRDISRYYKALVTNNHITGKINLCSGKGTLLQDIVDEAQKISGHYLEINRDLNYGGGLQARIQVGSNELLVSSTNISPKYSIRDTIDWMISNYHY